MNTDSAEYATHFTEGSPVSVGFDLADQTFFETAATVKNVQGTRVAVQFHETLPERIQSGARIALKTLGGWAVCCSHGVVAQELPPDGIALELSGAVDVQQRREHYRLDVALPLLHDVPDDQQMASVAERWERERALASSIKAPLMVHSREGWKVVYWRRRHTIKPSPMNLSASGIRTGLPTALTAGTLVNLQLFLPLTPPRVISAVGSVIRSTASEQTDDVPQTALHFECIAERDREWIISFLFLQQRNALRNRADERAAAYDEEDADGA